MDDSPLFPQALFSSPAWQAITIIVLVLQVLSLIAFIAILLEYLFIHNRQHKFLANMDDREGIAKHSKHFVTILYVIITIALLLVTTFIFVFQPHLL